ncbi:MAG: hypothetical protein ABI120_14060 [Gemmatimonadaceae bacterium]
MLIPFERRFPLNKKRITPNVAIAVAIATLLVGYADLWRGGATMSALLLTVAYLILVPIAIVTVPKREAFQNKQGVRILQNARMTVHKLSR